MLSGASVSLTAAALTPTVHSAVSIDVPARHRPGSAGTGAAYRYNRTAAAITTHAAVASLGLDTFINVPRSRVQTSVQAPLFSNPVYFTMRA